jgi:hypothetical protein
MAANKKSYDERIQDRLDASVKQLRDKGRLGAVLAVSPPDLRNRIHEADRRNQSK